MLFDAPLDILDMRKCSISSATRQLIRSASRSVLNEMNSMNSSLSESRTEFGSRGESTPKEGSTRRPLQFRRFYSSPQLIPKKSASSQSASPSIEDSTPGPSSLLPHPVPLALAHRMRLLSNFSLSLTKFEAAKD